LDRLTSIDTVARSALVNSVRQSKWQIAWKNLHYPVFSPDGRRLLADAYDQASKSFITQIWDISAGKKLVEWPGDLQSAHFSPDGPRIVRIVERKVARISDAQPGSIIADLLGHT